MYISEKLSVVSLGVNCLAEFHIQNFFQSRVGGFFDFNICTPDATIKVLNLLQNERDLEEMTNPDNYKIIYPDPTKETIAYKPIPGVYLFHEDNIDFNTMSKVKHQLDNMKLPTGKVVCIWSNVQANTLSQGLDFGQIKDDYILTLDRYYKIRWGVQKLYGLNTEVIYIVHKDLIEDRVIGSKNIYIWDIPQLDQGDTSWDETRDAGEKSLSRPIFEYYKDIYAPS